MDEIVVHENDPATQSQLERGLRVLAYIADAGAATVPEAAEAVGLPISSTYRYIRTLRDLHFLREESHGHYCVAGAALAIGGRHSSHARLAEVAPDILAQILSATGETAVVNVRVGTHAMCICRAEPKKSIKYSFGVNELLPLHAGAPQRVLLAWAPPGVIQSVTTGPLPAYSSTTLDRDSLLKSLVETRRHGFTISRGELDEGAVSVAVPVRHAGEVIGALNTAGPALECDSRTWLRKAISTLRRASDELGERFGAFVEEEPRRRATLTAGKQAAAAST